ncbi:MAG: RnfABCDGE type electron transport complex subunit D [Myxococcota bacterium]
MQDPRWAQIAVLLSLASWGAISLEFGFEWSRVLVLIGTALSVQALGNWSRGDAFEPRSALISALSLILLLRASDWTLCVAAAAIAVGSKFVFRAGGRHVFNPTNIALVVLLLVTDQVWVSSGQWGSGAIAVATCVAAALWVLPRVRGDVTIAFALFWTGLLFGRALYLGDPLAIPLHQLSSGTLFVFAAFMLSDPRTIPNARAGRVLFAAIVAGTGFVGRFYFYEPNALLFSLAGAALLVPVLDRLFDGNEFNWSDSGSTALADGRAPGQTRGGRDASSGKTSTEDFGDRAWDGLALRAGRS